MTSSLRNDAYRLRAMAATEENMIKRAEKGLENATGTQELAYQMMIIDKRALAELLNELADEADHG